MAQPKSTENADLDNFAPKMYAFVVVFLSEVHVFSQHIEWKHSFQRNGMSSKYTTLTSHRKIAEIILEISSKFSKNILFLWDLWQVF